MKCQTFCNICNTQIKPKSFLNSYNFSLCMTFCHEVTNNGNQPLIFMNFLKCFQPEDMPKFSSFMYESQCIHNVNLAKRQNYQKHSHNMYSIVYSSSFYVTKYYQSGPSDEMFFNRSMLVILSSALANLGLKYQEKANQNRSHILLMS